MGCSGSSVAASSARARSAGGVGSCAANSAVSSGEALVLMNAPRLLLMRAQHPGQGCLPNRPPLRYCVGPAVEGEQEKEAHHHHIFGTSMMCAFGVPGNMIHGAPSVGLDDSPVDAVVAPEM